MLMAMPSCITQLELPLITNTQQGPILQLGHNQRTQLGADLAKAIAVTAAFFNAVLTGGG
jgi:hypothetical protein